MLILPTDTTLLDLIKSNEGLELRAYKDILGHLTIGYGHKLSEDIPLEAAQVILLHDVREAWLDLINNYPHFVNFLPARQRALLDMRFWLGPSGFAGFRRMHSALHMDDFDGAAEEVLDSNAAKQVPWRARKIAKMLRDG